MATYWPELTGLTAHTFDAGGQSWMIRHADILEDQASTRLALLLDLEHGTEVTSIRLLFPAETHAVDFNHDVRWILDALKDIIESGQLREDGIYFIG
jgi:hypothetical protein